MVKHLVKHGNSLSLVIDKPILQMMGIDEETPVKLELKGKELVVSAADAREQSRAKKFREALEKVNRDHEKTLRRLAE